MATTRIAIAGTLAAVSITAGAYATLDSIYRAGDVLGVGLYWVPKTAQEPDTVTWENLQAAITRDERLPVHSIAEAAARLAPYGYAVQIVKNCPAMALALLTRMGYNVAALTQWHAGLTRDVVVAKPGMPVAAAKHSLVSNFQWERVESATIEPADLNRTDFSVAVHFVNHGFCEYLGRDLVTGDNRQMRGIDGMVVSFPEISYSEDLDMRRKVFGVCVITPIATTAADLVKQLERAMDDRRLDVTYKSPSIQTVVVTAKSAK